MAKKVLKNRVQFTSTLQIPMYKRLQEMSAKTHVPISKLLDVAVEAMLSKYEEPGHLGFGE